MTYAIWRYFTPEEHAAALAYQYAPVGDIAGDYGLQRVIDANGYCPLARSLQCAIEQTNRALFQERGLSCCPNSEEVAWWLERLHRLRGDAQYLNAAYDAAMFIKDWDTERIPVLADAIRESGEKGDIHATTV